MNSRVPASSTSKAVPQSRPLPSWTRRYLGAPNAMQQVVDEARIRFHASNPRIEQIGLEKDHIAEEIALKRKSLRRACKAKASTDFVRERFTGKFEGLWSAFDSMQFNLLCGAAVIGVGMAWTSLSSYVADSGFIPSLSDNFWKALFVSAAPVSGSFGLKAIGDHIGGDRPKRFYYIVLGGLGMVAMLVHVTAMSGVFAPQQTDLSAIEDALNTGRSLASNKSFLSNLASSIVLGSQLIAETLLAPAIMNAAAKHNQSKRKLEVIEHERHAVHDSIISELSGSIQHLTERYGAIGAEDKALLIREAEFIAEIQEAFGPANAAYEQAIAREQRKVFEHDM